MTPLVGPVEAPGLHVMTFNIRRRIPLSLRPADRWSRRHPLLRTILAVERPAVLAAQEVLPSQLAAIAAGLGPGYRRIGYGRLPGPRGEATPVFYDTDRLELEHGAQLALSDRPDEPGSRGWGAPIPRVFVEAVFRDRATAARFVVIGTHFDVFSARARLRSADAVRARIAAHGLPAVVLGDLNAAPESPPWRRLMSGDVLRDAWIAAEHRLTPEWGTLGSYRRPRPGGRRIDAILVSPGIRVARIGIHGHPLAGPWPSDHLPVQAVVHMPEATP